jgi:hypothetical protein
MSAIVKVVNRYVVIYVQIKYNYIVKHQMHLQYKEILFQKLQKVSSKSELLFRGSVFIYSGAVTIIFIPMLPFRKIER